MSDRNIKIELPRAIEVKLFIPVLSISAAILLFYLGMNNRPMMLIGAIALGFGLKALLDMNSKENKGNKYYNMVINNMGAVKDKEILKKLKDGLEIDEKNPYINYGLVMINYQNKNYTEVLKYIDNLEMDRIKKNPSLVLDREIINSLKGTAFYENNQYEGAIELLEPMMDSNNLYKIIVSLSYREIGNIEKSLEILETGMLEGSSQYDEIAFYYWEGVNLFDLGRMDEARERFERASDIDEEYADVKKYLRKIK